MLFRENAPLCDYPEIYHAKNPLLPAGHAAPSPRRFHAHRALGRDRDHCRPHRLALARRTKGAGSGRAGEVLNGYWTLPKTGFDPTKSSDQHYPSPNGPIGDDAKLRDARQAVIPPFVCPSDPGPRHNEEYTAPYGFERGNYRGCVGSGDMYGSATDTTTGPWGKGIFGVQPKQTADPGKGPQTRGVRFADIPDGASNTLLLSEGIVATVTTQWGGPMGETIYGNMGGALFSATLTPNSTAADRVIGPCPKDLSPPDPLYKAPCLSLGGNAWWTPSAAKAHAGARSYHNGGVNGAMADGSVRFFANTIDQFTWRALATRSGGEAVSDIQ